MFKKNTRARTNAKSKFVSVKGVNLWNGCHEKLKCVFFCI